MMITHETDIAGQAKRIITIRDGRIISDVKNKPVEKISNFKNKGIHKT